MANEIPEQYRIECSVCRPFYKKNGPRCELADRFIKKMEKGEATLVTADEEIKYPGNTCFINQQLGVIFKSIGSSKYEIYINRQNSRKESLV